METRNQSEDGFNLEPLRKGSGKPGRSGSLLPGLPSERLVVQGSAGRDNREVAGRASVARYDSNPIWVAELVEVGKPVVDGGIAKHRSGACRKLRARIQIVRLQGATVSEGPMLPRNPVGARGVSTGRIIHDHYIPVFRAARLTRHLGVAGERVPRINIVRRAVVHRTGAHQEGGD